MPNVNDQKAAKAAAYADLIKSRIADLKPMKDYAADFAADCKANHPRISTGLLSFDIALNGGLAEELYIMSAETSTGKSAFMMSVAQHIAESGINVLYFAMEMGKKEFTARGISTISYEHSFHDKMATTVPVDSFDDGKKFVAGDVLYWKYDYSLKMFTRVPYEQYSGYADEYFKRYGDHLYILEALTDGFTVKDIANIAALFKRQTQQPVVVFVDYLQLIKADPDDRSQTDRKTKMDVCVTTLKALASQVGMPVFTISSVGRASYGKDVGLSSNKESGDTEYTGGVMIGWNWDGVSNAANEEAANQEKELCKQRGYRKMKLEILKFRNAARDNSINLTYYPAYSYFAGPDEDGFIPIGDAETPFDDKKTLQKRVVEG